MVDVATLALEARTDGLKKAEVALDRVTAAAIKTDAAADRMTAGAGRADAAVGNMGRSAGAAKAGFQNLGYQVQDFAVQVGSGTSASQALGQQLPQLLSGFGMLGVALGTAAAVLVPLAGAFFGSSEQASRLAGATRELAAATAEFKLQSDALRLGVDPEEVAIVQNLNSLIRQRVELEAEMANVSGRALAPLQLQLSALNRNIDAAQGQVGAYRSARSELDMLQRLTEAQAGSTRNVTNRVDEAKSAMVALVNSAPGGGWLAGAIGDAASLASNLWDAAAALAANRIAGAKVRSLPAGGVDAVAAGDVNLGGANNYVRYVDPTVKFGGAGSGGGAGGSSGGGAPADDGFQAKLDALTESLQTERETTDAWYAESMAIMDDRRAQELLGAQGHADALVAIEAELQKRKAEVRDADLGHYESFFGAMAGALQSGGGKMLAISKGFALAEAAVSIWRGAAKALELPFPASLSAWGQVIATGAKALSGIKGASFGGGSVGGGGGASVGSSQVTAPSAPDRTIRVNVDGEGLFSDMLRNSIRTIATALGEEQNIGGFVVA